MIKNEFVNFQGNLYLIKRIIKEELNPNIDAWKEQLRSDIVLKKDGLFYFLETVPDLEIIEYVNNKDIV